MKTTAKLDAPSHRWLAELASFNFDIVYRPGKSNTNADILSRLLGTTQKQEICVIDYGIRVAISQAVRVPLVETLCMSAKVLDLDDFKAETTIGMTGVRKRQREDPDIGPILQQVSQGVQPTLGKLTIGSSRYRLAKEFDNLMLKRGLLYRLTTVVGQEHFQVVMPKVSRELILTSLHDNAGHQRRDKILSLVRD